MQNKIDYPIKAYPGDFGGSTSHAQKIHMGDIVERIVRRDRMGISELARRLNVSRRTLYNWFESEQISAEIIHRIGFIIGHDFSFEFPHELAKRSDFANDESLIDAPNLPKQPGTVVYYWMDKYIKLLEKFNSALSENGKFNGLVFLFAEFWLIMQNPPASIN